MSEFENNQLPNFSSPEALTEYLGDLPQPMGADDVDFIEKARWMLEDWEAGDRADKEIEPELKQILEKTNPNWLESYKKLMRQHLHDAGHIDTAIDLARELLSMPREERIESVLELEQVVDQKTKDYLDLVTRIIINKKQQEVGLPGSLTESVESILAGEDRLKAAWRRFFPEYDASIRKTDNNDPTNFSFVFKGREGATDLIADFTYDLEDGHYTLKAWRGSATVDYQALTDTVEEASVTRTEPLEIDEFQQQLILSQKALYEWYAHYHGHIMNSVDEVTASLDISPDDDDFISDSLHEDLSIDVQRYHFDNFLAGSERLYRLFK